jgi:hypothetical protein
VELLDSASEFVRDRASSFVLGLAGIQPAANPSISLNIDVKGGYVIDLSDDPPRMRYENSLPGTVTTAFPTRQAAAIEGGSRRGAVTGKLRTALDLMVWEGDKRADAAARSACRLLAPFSAAEAARAAALQRRANCPADVPEGPQCAPARQNCRHQQERHGARRSGQGHGSHRRPARGEQRRGMATTPACKSLSSTARQAKGDRPGTVPMTTPFCNREIRPGLRAAGYRVFRTLPTGSVSVPTWTSP